MGAELDETLFQLANAALGQPCSPAWLLPPPPQGADPVRWLWEKTIQSPPIAFGRLKMPAPTGPRTFRILCNREVAVVHPDDAGWLVRAVAPYMSRIRPIWAERASTVLTGASSASTGTGLRVPAGLFPWLPGPWTCPECWPKLDLSGECSPPCTIDKVWGGPSTSLRDLYGYDPRAMLPWATNIRSVPTCGKGGPGGPDTLCMPVDGFCWATGSAKDYVSAFWQDVGNAINVYHQAQDYLRATGQLPPITPSPASASASSTPTPTPLRTIKRASNWYPLLAFSLAAGLVSVFLAYRAR